MKRKPYPSDLTDAAWAILERLLSVFADSSYRSAIAQRFKQAYPCTCELTEQFGQGVI